MPFRNSKNNNDKIKKAKTECFFYSPFADCIMFPDFWTSSNFVKITFNLYKKCIYKLLTITVYSQLY